MKHPTLIAASVLSACIFSSCAAGQQDFEKRKDSDIRFNKERLASTKSEIASKWSKDILSALAVTDSKTASNPKLASAILSGKDGKYALFVFWIENQPSADGVELRFSNAAVPVAIPTPEQELKQVRNEAEVGIVFGYEFDSVDTPGLSRNLEQILASRDLKIRLLRANVPITDWFAVDLHDDGKWINLNPTNR